MPSDPAISVPAPAKLNLYLHVTGRRDDGYHELDSLVAFTRLGDTVSVTAADDLTLSATGPFAGDLPGGGDNIVLEAADRLRQLAEIGTGADITLHKCLPVASGIGGGSADAAAAITALRRLWDFEPAASDVSALALELGADVPVCLAGEAAYMGGIGEVLEPFPALPEIPVVLVNPGVAVSTADVFRARTGPFTPPNRFAGPVGHALDLAQSLAARQNDLTAAATAQAPVIGDALTALGGCTDCLLTRMSGSGATCFALFALPAAAEAAAKRIAAAYPDWWVEVTELAS